MSDVEKPQKPKRQMSEETKKMLQENKLKNRQKLKEITKVEKQAKIIENVRPQIEEEIMSKIKQTPKRTTDNYKELKDKLTKVEAELYEMKLRKQIKQDLKNKLKEEKQDIKKSVDKDTKKDIREEIDETKEFAKTFDYSNLFY